MPLENNSYNLDMTRSSSPDLQTSSPAEHPLDVLRSLSDWQKAGQNSALAILTDTQGGAVRARGAVMAICEDGRASGYLSGGCVDADIIQHGKNAIRSGVPASLLYGKGSPFMDITLPCGGAIEVTIVPNIPPETIKAVVDRLEHRSAASLQLTTPGMDINVQYTPKLRLRIAGRNADPLALARIAIASGIETELWSNDGDCLGAASNIAELTTIALGTPSSLPDTQDDACTAFVLMMHDPDWEMPLLKQSLLGQAFYIGAVGSPRTHQMRCARLLEAGVPASSIERIHGPIGLVPSLRNASTLGVSTLAEIIAEFDEAHPVLSISLKEQTHV